MRPFITVEGASVFTAVARGSSVSARSLTTNRNGKLPALPGTGMLVKFSVSARAARSGRTLTRCGKLPPDSSTSITLEDAHRGTTRTVQTPPHPLSGQPGKRIEVKIPRGVDTGSRVHVAGLADGMLDLNVVIQVRPHATFERRGDDLGVTVEVPLTDAALGAEIEVPTIDGRRVALRVPPETQNGRTFRLRGKGMPRLRGSGHGDLLAMVKVVLPQDLSSEERALFEGLRAAREGGAQAQETV